MHGETNGNVYRRAGVAGAAVKERVAVIVEARRDSEVVWAAGEDRGKVG